MTNPSGLIRFATPVPRQGVVIVALAGTMLDPGVVFSRLAHLAEASLVATDWIRASDDAGLRTVTASLAHELNERRAEPVVVIGHSSGGAIAMMLAIEHPQLVAGLLLINTGANTQGHGDPDAPKRLAASGLVPDVVDRFIARCFATPPSPAMADDLRAYALACPLKCVVSAMNSQRSIDLTSGLSQIACPTGIVHGVRDQVRTRRHIDVLLDGIAGATLVNADCGHTPLLELPSTVDGALRNLLKRVRHGVPDAVAPA